MKICSKLANFYIRAMRETGLFKVKDLNELISQLIGM